MTDRLFIRLCHRVYRRLGLISASYPWTTILISVALTIVMTAKMAVTPQVSAMDGMASDDARSRMEYNTFQEFLNADGEGITLGLLIQARDSGNLLRMEYMNQTVEILDTISTQFPMFDSELLKNQTFSEFCSGFCQANEPVRQFYNGLLVTSSNDSDSLDDRIHLAYPTSKMFGRSFSLLPNFFGVELDEDGESLRSVSLVVLYFRAEKHPSWTKEMVKQWEINIETYFREDYDQSSLKVLVFSPAIVEKEVVRAGMSLQPFLGIGFVIMTIFCSCTTTISAVALYGQKATWNKVVLSVLACVNPIMACGTAMGALFFAGLQQFSPILCITPFLVLAISVDDSFLMLHAWNRIEKKERWSVEKKKRVDKIAEVLVETGPAITISALTNMLAFAIGAATSPQEIRIFCIGNAACIFMDMLFQATFYAAAMTLFADGPDPDEKESKTFSSLKTSMVALLHGYVDLISKPLVSASILALWMIYLAGAIYGLTLICVDMSPEKLFLPDSPILEIDMLRSTAVIPFFTPATVVVNSPGDLDDPETIQALQEMKQSFERMPGGIGNESTKFFLEDFTAFKESQMEEDELGSENTIESFLEWPEFSFWKGFVSTAKLDKNGSSTSIVDKFMFTTGFHGAALRSWAERVEQLNRWRDEVDRHSRFNATIFTDDAFYLDLLERIPSITWQSAVATFVCMIFVCGIFIVDPFTVFAVSLSILSTCLGVFGYLCLWGVNLDPIMMSISIMCIGFSVDIPAHVSFHFYASKYDSNNAHQDITSPSVTTSIAPKENSFRTRLRHTMSSVGFPVIQAGVSTDLCALPMVFVQLYMAQIFAWSMTLCVTLSLLHGLVIIPAMFSVKDYISKVISRR